MVGSVLRRRFAPAALVSAAFIVPVGWVPRLATADIVYKLIDYPADQNGWSISGTITTDGKTTTDGDISTYLTSSDINAWSWTATEVTPMGTTTISESWSRSGPALPAGSNLILEVDNLHATAQSLSVAVDQTIFDESQLEIGINYSSGNTYLNWFNLDGAVTYQGVLNPEFPPLVGWNTTLASDISTNDNKIATLAPGSGGAVPEPSSLMIWSGLASIGVFFNRFRRTRTVCY